MTNEIQSLVSDFASQLTTLVRRMALDEVRAALDEVRAALGDVGGAPARRGPGRPKVSTNAAAPKAKRGGKRVRRSAEDLAAMSDALLAHVKANPGHRGEQIAAALKTDVGTMRKPMLALVAAKKVSTKGQRRGMTYYADGNSSGAGPAGMSVGNGRKAKRGGKRAAKKKAA